MNLSEKTIAAGFSFNKRLDFQEKAGIQGNDLVFQPYGFVVYKE